MINSCLIPPSYLPTPSVLQNGQRTRKIPHWLTGGTFPTLAHAHTLGYMSSDRLWWPLGSFQFSSVQVLSRVQLFATPWTAAHQASLSITNSWSSPKLMSIESVMPSSHLILCCPLLLPPSIFPSIRVFSNELVLRIRWPKYREFQLQHQSFQ